MLYKGPQIRVCAPIIISPRIIAIGEISRIAKLDGIGSVAFNRISMKEGYGTPASLVNVGFVKNTNSEDIYECFAGSFRLQMSDKRTCGCQNKEKHENSLVPSQT